MDIFLTILTSGIVSGLVGFIFRTYISQRIKNEYDMKLETHKAELKAQNEVEIERLRSSLTAMANEKQVRFSSFHEKLKEIVPETYARIQRHRHAVHEYTKSVLSETDPPLADRRRELDERRKEFWDYFLPNQLYFREDLSQEIRALCDLSLKAGKVFWRVHESGLCSEMPLDQFSELNDKWESLLRDENELFIKIRRQFQELIGVPLTDGEPMR